MHTIQPARLKKGTAPESLREAVRGRHRHVGEADSRQSADLLGPDEPAGDEVREETRRDRHRSDHACGRLRLREPRYARRELEDRLVPVSDAGFPRPGPPRRELRHRRRPLRDRLVAGNESGRTEGRRRGSRARDGRRRRQQHGRHLPPQQLQSRAARRPEPRGRGRRAGRRRVQLRSGDAQAAQRDAAEGLRAGSAVGERRRDPPERRHLRRRTPRVQAVGRDQAVDRLGRSSEAPAA